MSSESGGGEIAGGELSFETLPEDSRPLDLGVILTRAHETAYRWCLNGDRIDWANNAATVLGLSAGELPLTGRAFGLLVDSRHAETRFDAIAGRARQGIASMDYRVQYRIMPKGRRDEAGLWIEEEGCLVSGPDGAPQAAEAIMRVINERHDREQRLIYLSEHDQLTGQLNRARLMDELQRVLDRLRNGPDSAGFLLAAIPDLALINETYGFEVGDQVIAIVGQRLRHALRGRDCIGRYAANKFGIVLQTSGIKRVEAVASRLIRGIRDNMVKTSVGMVPVTLAVGALKLPDHGIAAREVIARAMETLDRARASRSTGFAVYQPCERRDSERRNNIAVADEIIRALNDRRLMLALQPIVLSGEREPALYECLLRLKKPDNTVLGAGAFIPIAEQFGLCRLIDHRVLELAIDMLRGNERLQLSINVSASSASGTEWLAALESFTCGDRALTERLTIEITETSAISDIDSCIQFVRAVQTLGCRVALDDFGAGHTSFRNLKMLGVDMVKIDGAFVENLGRSSEDQLFVRTLIDLAKSFGIATVGEWVEDAATAEILENAGISYMQGFHFGAPELAGGAPAHGLAAQA